MIRSAFARRLALIPVLAAAFIGGAPASGAIVSGSNLASAPDSIVCINLFFKQLSCTAAVSALPPGSQAPGGETAAIDGVVVSWSIRSGGNPRTLQIALHLVRGSTGVATGPIESLPTAPGIFSYPARLPARAGDEIGVDLPLVPETDSVLILRDADGATSDFWSPLLGATETRSATTFPDKELLVNATIEPDADHDGFGDETQDACPTVATVAGPCPPPPPAPDTKITKGPKGKIDSHRAKFKFKSEPAGAKFECKLDRKPFKPCKSPKTYRNLSAGKHRFRVRAVTAGGTVDPTPAKRSFRVEI
jgi:hypothetical protein